MDPSRSVTERAECDAAVELLRTVDPHVLSEDDATPERRHLFRIHADEITGRQAS